MSLCQPASAPAIHITNSRCVWYIRVQYNEVQLYGIKTDITKNSQMSHYFSAADRNGTQILPDYATDSSRMQLPLVDWRLLSNTSQIPSTENS